MNNDFLDPINAENMPWQADSAMALEFLITAKTGVRNTAIALTETASPEARTVLRRQLSEALALHEEIYTLMMEKGWFHPYELKEQVRLDMSSSDTMVKIANLELFPGETNRRGTFATPNI
ncbi:MAG TPA: spore coat protein [Symbiobacteriaceae bacterium]|nr:spore coat protein [Symbiobacteriaceae bacterium]